MGWAYYCRDQRLQSYFLADANLTNQSWFAHSAPNTDYVGQQLSYRMALNSRNRYVYGAWQNNQRTPQGEGGSWQPQMQRRAS